MHGKRGLSLGPVTRHRRGVTLYKVRDMTISPPFNLDIGASPRDSESYERLRLAIKVKSGRHRPVLHWIAVA